MNNLIQHREIQNLIYSIRGMEVMLDSDLAMMYGVETKVLNQAVKRNSVRFPESFRFQLSDAEVKNLRLQITTTNDGSRSQNVTLNTKRGKNVKYMP
jgi:hypothetical protein